MRAVTVKIIGRKIIRAANGIVDFMVLTIILLLIAVAAYAIWDTGQIYQAADSSQYSLYKPGEEGGMSYEELQAINPEVFCWLTVYGTNIDYPVTQGMDNAKYVNTNAFGEYSLSGAIFLDYSNNQDFQDFNSILYGHHMEKQAMFGELESFGSKSFFDSHAYGNLYYNGKDHGLEFFAFLKTDAYDGGVFTPRVQGEETQQANLQYLLEKAMFTRDIGVTIEDRILLLTTCSSEATNGRDILVARISDECYSNAFAKEEPDNRKITVSVDQQVSPWESIPLQLKIMVPVILLMLFAVVFYRIYRKKRAKE